MLRTADIVLVAMPFGSLEWPPASLGALSAALKASGMTCRSTYPVLRFAELIGYQVYNAISGALSPDVLLHDWLFSTHLMPPDGAALAAYIDDLNRILDDNRAAKLQARPKGSADTAAHTRFFREDGRLREDTLLALRDAAGGFVTRTAEAIVAGRPKVVGCTTTFLQFNASVSLLKEVKRLDPSVVTVLGGAGVEAEMGYQALRHFPCIDLVFSGEADSLFPAVCMDLLAGADLAAIAQHYPAGLLARPFVDGPHHRDEAARRWRAPVETNLDDLPIPDHDDYFTELAASPLRLAFRPNLAAESSRGCWKGAAQHCAFCGLLGERMAYRSKSPERLIEELDELHRRHGNDVFLMTDTIIPMRSFKTVLPALARDERPFALFYEVPPKLTEEQVRQLAEAKVRWIQPGIESLDDRLLQLMNKGNRAIRNIETLKYCLEQGIHVRWNILYDIPGDDDECYRRMARIVPLLCHLPPPRLARIRFDRFSPYHRDSATFGLALRPLARHQLVYPFGAEDLEDFALFYESREPTPDPLFRSPATAGLAESVRHWLRDATPTPPQLVQIDTGTAIDISDTRPCAIAPSHRLTGEAALIYRACRTATPIGAIQHSVGPQSAQRTADILEALHRAGLAIDVDGEWLALATNLPVRPISADIDFSPAALGDAAREAAQ